MFRAFLGSAVSLWFSCFGGLDNHPANKYNMDPSRLLLKRAVVSQRPSWGSRVHGVAVQELKLRYSGEDTILTLRVHVPNNWVLRALVRLIIVQVLGKNMII